MSEPESLKGKHVLVTGAGKRIGRALAERFLNLGCKVSAHSHTSHADIAALVSQANQHNQWAFGISADLEKKQEIEAAVEKAYAQFGKFDVLVNSASVFYRTPSEAVTDEEWEHFLNINLRGQFYFAQSVRKRMDSGSIINLADSHATHTRKGFTPYICSKAGLLQLTRNLAAEYAPHIRVNAVSPGPVLQPENYSAEQIERAANSTLLKRWGNADDVVEAVLFLLRNTYITGIDLPVDGGRN